MIFTKLRYKNILSTGNVWTEVCLNAHKTTLIVGENGAGKSTMLDAISFALFNKPFRSGFNKPQLVNSINSRDCVVEVEFYIGQKSFKIIRGIKPAIFQVYEDDVLINQDANVRDYQNYLETNVIKTNHKTFCQVVILSKDDYIPFMRLPAQFRREVVEDILDLTIFSTMNSLLLTKRQQNENEVAGNLHEKRMLDQRIELIKEHTDEMTSTNNQIIKDKKERIKTTDDYILIANQERIENSSVIRGLRQKIVDEDKQKNLQSELTHIKYKLESKISNLKKGIDFFHDNETCPTCSQDIDVEFKCEITAKKQAALDEASEGLIKVTTKLGQVNERLKVIDKIDDDIIELDFANKRIDGNIEQHQSYIKELNSDITQLESHNKRVDKSELVRLDSQLADVSIKYNQLIKRKNMLELSGILLKDSGIKAKIIKQYIPIINTLINKYLGMLDFFVKFTIDEEFEERILSRFRDEFTYGSFSGGEKFRINLALLFTWRAIAKMRNSLNTNILFFDELLDSSLDFNGTEEALKILNQTDPGTNIFIISHRVDQMLDKFENIIKFEKHKSFSRMVSI